MLKRKRDVRVQDINFKLAAVTERGTVVIYDTVNAGFVKKTAGTLTVTDKAAGVLLIDVVNDDFGAVPENHQKLEVGLSGYVPLCKQGELVINTLAAGEAGNFGPGSGVYLDINGLVRNKPVSGFADDHAGLRLGTALSSVDSDGYVQIYFDIN